MDRGSVQTDAAVVELYGLPPEQFVAARNQLARRSATAGRCGGVEGVFDEFGAHVVGDRPASQAAGVAVDHRGGSNKSNQEQEDALCVEGIERWSARSRDATPADAMEVVRTD